MPLEKIQRLLVFSFIFNLHCTSCLAQDFVDYTWWNETHNWDGVTPWWEYIRTTPAFLGPNALPVPRIQNGSIPENAYLSFNGEAHISAGDQTQNIHTELYFPLFTKRVGLNLQYIPIEWYNMDTVTRDIRRARNVTGEGFAVGDIYVSTYIQVIQEHHTLPDVLLTVNLKTASGGSLSDARFTDAPGYFFDASFSKDYNLNKQGSISIRPHLMLGFYVWQMHGRDNFQNDALSYGLGFDLNFPKLSITNAVGGYYGYLNKGDRPAVFRSSIRTQFESLLNYQFQIQHGLHDFEYTSFRLGITASLEQIKLSFTE
jgi:hypothetical protein